MSTATFRDRMVEPKSGGSSGHTWYCEGEFLVFVEQIPADAPTDWSFGPKMKPGEWGVFLANPCHASGHSPYAIATAKNEADARIAAAGGFKARLTEWEA